MKRILMTWLTRCRTLVMQGWQQMKASAVAQEFPDQAPVRKVSPMDDAAVADLAERIVLFVYMLMKQTGTANLTTPYMVSWDMDAIRLQMGIEDEELFMQAWFCAQDAGWIARPNPFGKVSRRPEVSAFETPLRKRDYLQ